jgi:hypothetical protein
MKSLLLVLFISLSYAAVAQPLSVVQRKTLQAQEAILKKQAEAIIFSERFSDRLKADSLFTRGLVKALKENNSFSYPFDSIRNVAKIYPEDSSFRIFTWQLIVSENFVRIHGAIQMKTADGSLKLIPLIDKSDLIVSQRDTITDAQNWLGAVYTSMVQKEHEGKKYYTLFGFNFNNIRTDRKIIEVLTFQDGKPVFGGKHFYFESTNQYSKDPARIIMEFKEAVSPHLSYDKELRMIMMEHLVSETGDAKKTFTLVPDGDYEGFNWLNGKWIHVSKVFNEVTPEGQAPMPLPLHPQGEPVPPIKGTGGGR